MEDRLLIFTDSTPESEDRPATRGLKDAVEHAASRASAVAVTTLQENMVRFLTGLGRGRLLSVAAQLKSAGADRYPQGQYKSAFHVDSPLAQGFHFVRDFEFQDTGILHPGPSCRTVPILHSW